MRSIVALTSLLFLPLATSALCGAERQLRILPESAALRGRFDQIQLLVSAAGADDALTRNDLTSSAAFASSDPAVATVSSSGRLRAVGDGRATVTVTVGESTAELPVTVSGAAETESSFVLDIRPLLNKTGCAAAACHASQYGKGGFKLSVFGFDPKEDYEAMARAGRQRRVNFASPDSSLLLRKPAMAVSHGGGRRFTEGSVEYDVLRTWIAAGAPGPDKDAPPVESLEVTPKQRLASLEQSQQLRVIAHYGDQTRRDVTAWAKYDSTDEGVLAVDESGRVQLHGRGQASVMVRFEEQAEIATFVVPFGERAELAGWESRNFVDELAADKFRQLSLEPSPLCDDATFVRRAFLDAIGTLPSPQQTLAFVESTDSGKRDRLIDQLLGLTGDPEVDVHNDHYAAYWTLKWSDLIRNSSKTLGEQGMWALHNWIRESLRVNKPFDAFVRELVTAKGSIYSNGPANYYRINTDTTALTESTAQLFLGVRLECAKCHHHPFEKYSQADYYGLAAFFSRVGSKNSEEFGLFGRESVVLVKSSGEVSHPKTGQRLAPTPLGGEPIDDPLDRRIPLADWLTSNDNAFFARAVANRYVGYLLGRGLVEPIDDMRSTNPASNEQLLDALARQFVQDNYNLKLLMRHIMTSRLYQLDSQPTPANAADRKFYSSFRVKRLAAEPLLDAIDQATGAQTKFKSQPLGTRAIDLPDAEYPNLFLGTFAKPKRASVCECERSPDPNLAQALHMLNGDTIEGKVTDKKGRIAKLLQEKKPHAEIVRELYLAALCRPPSPAELAYSDELLQQSADPQQCYVDLLWALINSKQFVFVH